MLVSHKYKFIYTKTVKTASSSVENFFEPFCLKETENFQYERKYEYVSDTGIVGSRTALGLEKQACVWWNHMPALTIKALLGERCWDKYYKFCVVRNPFDQLVSAFNFFSSPKIFQYYPIRILESSIFYRLPYLINPKVMQFIELSYFKNIGTTGLQKNFEEWLTNIPLPIDNNKYMIDDDFCMDYVIKFESLSEDIKHVCRELGIINHNFKLPHLKKSKRVKLPLKSYYNNKSIEIVEQAYSKQFEIFGYSRPWN